MEIGRRAFLVTTGGAVAGRRLPALNLQKGAGAMFGLIGRITAVGGKRDELIAILLAGVSGMPGCLSYIVASDPASTDGIWVTEVWDSKESHQASLALPSVRDAIAKGRPLIATFGDSIETMPVGGHGLLVGRAE